LSEVERQGPNCGFNLRRIIGRAGKGKGDRETITDLLVGEEKREEAICSWGEEVFEDSYKQIRAPVGGCLKRPNEEKVRLKSGRSMFYVLPKDMVAGEVGGRETNMPQRRNRELEVAGPTQKETKPKQDH